MSYMSEVLYAHQPFVKNKHHIETFSLKVYEENKKLKDEVMIFNFKKKESILEESKLKLNLSEIDR